jgi:hypothetical protein
MGQDKKTPIVINDVEYFIEDMTDPQKNLLNHVADLDRKLSSARFNVQQLEVGREAFINMLAQALEQQPEVEPETEKAA